MANLHKIKAYLYDNVLTEDPFDFMARVAAEHPRRIRRPCDQQSVRTDHCHSRPCAGGIQDRGHHPVFHRRQPAQRTQINRLRQDTDGVVTSHRPVCGIHIGRCGRHTNGMEDSKLNNYEKVFNNYSGIIYLSSN